MAPSNFYRSLIRDVLFLGLLLTYAASARAGEVSAAHAVVATANRDATEAALKTLQAGGNAFDAAVVAALVLSVVEPQSSGIGGGGFALIYEANTKKSLALDFRERAPALAHKDMYIRGGAAAAELSQTGALAVGVPGQLAGLLALHEKRGKKPFSSLFDAAIVLADQGARVSARLGQAFASEQERLKRYASTRAAWLHDGTVPKTGEFWKQPELARSLTLLKQKGVQEFYTGEIARKIVATTVANAGILSGVDLADYRVRWLEPVRGTYRGFDIVSMPPPSSGGVHLIEMLNMLETRDLRASGYRSPDMMHMVIETMRRAYADRAEFLGDPAFANVPTTGLVAKSYAQKRAAEIGPAASKLVAAGQPLQEHKETTHFSIVDGEGNAVALTTTVNGPFGSALVAEGTGILLNNQMDDFAIAPGVPNLYGLVGSAANSVQARKTPLSSMTPTLVFKDKKLRWALGSPGGSTIITTVLWALIHLIDFDADTFAAIAAPRVHEQWKPDVVMLEPLGMEASTRQELTSRGHTFKQQASWGNAHIVGITPQNARVGAADPRGDGVALGY